MLKLKLVPPILAAVMAVFMWLVAKYMPGIIIFPPPFNLFGIVFSVAGIIIDLASIFMFLMNNTTINPFRPDKSSALVISGTYKLSRNPMYLGLMLILGGWAVYLGAISAWFFIPLYILAANYFQIIPEEKLLLKKFGAQFREYQTSVRRWL